MPKSKRTIDDVDAYESDDFVSNDDGKAKSKKSKKVKTSSQPKDAGPNTFWSLSSGRNPRRVEISDFKGTKLVSIREYYEKDDAYLPGKKGISLSVDQYRALLNAIPKVNSVLKKGGIDVEADDDEESEPEEKPQRKAKAKNSKANIEATSDEDEDEE